MRAFQDALGWPVLVQEQEAYLLPGLTSLDSFVDQHTTAAWRLLLGTPGPTAGSCVVFVPDPWKVLFCGRLLIPVAFVQLASLADWLTFIGLSSSEAYKNCANGFLQIQGLHWLLVLPLGPSEETSWPMGCLGMAGKSVNQIVQFSYKALRHGPFRLPAAA